MRQPPEKLRTLFCCCCSLKPSPGQQLGGAGGGGVAVDGVVAAVEVGQLVVVLFGVEGVVDLAPFAVAVQHEVDGLAVQRRHFLRHVRHGPDAGPFQHRWSRSDRLSSPDE
jgi:hypothetical protein